MKKVFENSLLVGKVKRQYVCSLFNTGNLDAIRNTDFQFTIDDQLLINIFLTEIREIHFILFF